MLLLQIRVVEWVEVGEVGEEQEVGMKEVVVEQVRGMEEVSKLNKTIDKK